MKRKDLTGLDAIEQAIESELKELIQDAIGHCPADVSCTFVGQSDLAILIEGVSTPLDSFLQCYCPSEVVSQYRKGLQLAIGNRVQRLIEQTIERPIDSVSVSRPTATRWMGIFVLL